MSRITPTLGAMHKESDVKKKKKSEVKWIEMHNKRKKKEKKKSEVNWNEKKKKISEKWSEVKKKGESEESSKVIKSNPWPSCNPQESKFEPLLSISLWAKNQILHYKPSKSPLWSIEVVHVNYVRLDPFWVHRQPCELQPHHII